MEEQTRITQFVAGYDLERFFELSADLFCIAGFDGYFKKINPTVSKTLGFTEAELFSRPINSFVHPDDQDVTNVKRDRLRHDTPLLNFENRYVTKSGEIVWLAWTSMPVPDEQLVFAIAKNITYKKKQEEGRNAMLADLTAINHELKQLTYTTSHDLRMPVNNLLAIFGLMNKLKIEDRETLEFIAVLKMAADALKGTLNNYVDALGQKNVLNIETEPVNIAVSLANVMRSLSGLIQSSGAVIDIRFDDFDTVIFNKSYMESILINLLTNAIKYAKPDGSPKINISTRHHDGLKQLVFADEGLGFDMDNVRDKIFGLHQSFHGHADSKGIGLYLVYNHVTGLGGDIAVESEVNKGARFTITFREHL
ncbi:PAS domain-containing sensor histidine kinase [Mucilaginibacter myungsuensis]|uniref:histidine kinase n=1 Tax=Mucilaginibacter myungsuensis TaxID=649104 RepID=A0A929KV45_9SPHI|nr:PAS domain-containing sensor histidine kinase [Mucilaginibacter myungsuensis]MBE9662154.1 PAS domain S-box protein [Mucilaginibacter myungsuensis]MDN3599412.1 PAS domain-containing sensor histidine kinase [Mucilaginibacter myungsuensis]